MVEVEEARMSEAYYRGSIDEFFDFIGKLKLETDDYVIYYFVIHIGIFPSFESERVYFYEALKFSDMKEDESFEEFVKHAYDEVRRLEELLGGNAISEVEWWLRAPGDWRSDPRIYTNSIFAPLQFVAEIKFYLRRVDVGDPNGLLGGSS